MSKKSTAKVEGSSRSSSRSVAKLSDFDGETGLATDNVGSPVRTKLSKKVSNDDGVTDSPKKAPSTPNRRASSRLSSAKTPVVTPRTPRVGKNFHSAVPDAPEVPQVSQDDDTPPTSPSETISLLTTDAKPLALTAEAYKIVRKMTGSLGGNGAGGLGPSV